VQPLPGLCGLPPSGAGTRVLHRRPGAVSRRDQHARSAVRRLCGVPGRGIQAAPVAGRALAASGDVCARMLSGRDAVWNGPAATPGPVEQAAVSGDGPARRPGLVGPRTFGARPAAAAAAARGFGRSGGHPPVPQRLRDRRAPGAGSAIGRAPRADTPGRCAGHEAPGIPRQDRARGRVAGCCRPPARPGTPRPAGSPVLLPSCGKARHRQRSREAKRRTASSHRRRISPSRRGHRGRSPPATPAGTSSGRAAPSGTARRS
jgi:hypothetical protein